MGFQKFARCPKPEFILQILPGQEQKTYLTQDMNQTALGDELNEHKKKKHKRGKNSPRKHLKTEEEKQESEVESPTTNIKIGKITSDGAK